MNKVWLIIKREYLTRVRKKTFIITTLLFPLFYLLLIFGAGFIAEKSKQHLRVAVIDSSGYFTESRLQKENNTDPNSTLVLVKDNRERIIAEHEKEGYDAYVIIPRLDWRTGNPSLELKANKSYGSAPTGMVEGKLNRVWDEIKNDSLN